MTVFIHGSFVAEISVQTDSETVFSSVLVLCHETSVPWKAPAM